MYELECPYCEEKFEIDEFEDSFEKDCPHCNEAFKVEVEYEPVFRESKFNFVDCEECSIAFDKDYIVRMPIAKGYNSSSSLCTTCYYKLQDYQK